MPFFRICVQESFRSLHSHPQPSNSPSFATPFQGPNNPQTSLHLLNHGAGSIQTGTRRIEEQTSLLIQPSPVHEGHVGMNGGGYSVTQGWERYPRECIQKRQQSPRIEYTDITLVSVSHSTEPLCLHHVECDLCDAAVWALPPHTVQACHVCAST